MSVLTESQKYSKTTLLNDDRHVAHRNIHTACSESLRVHKTSLVKVGTPTVTSKQKVTVYG